MTPKEMAEDLMDRYLDNGRTIQEAKNLSFIAVNLVISANPHSNPLNTNVYSTMDYWQEVKKELEKL